MTVAAFKMYGAALEANMKATLDLDSDHFRMVLVTSSYTPNQSTHATWADASANEVAAGGGYSTNGKTLAVTVVRSGLAVTFDCDDQTWTAATITAKYALIVKDADNNGVVASTDSIVAYSDLSSGGGSISVSGVDLVVTTASGIFTATAS